MSRWIPDAAGRLQQAAYELFLERGYEETTVADIAARAGVTERTFFRHYTDKREVLFSGAVSFNDVLTRAVEHTSHSAPVIDVVRAAVVAISELMHGRREGAIERRKLIARHSDLRERDLQKRAMLTNALGDALRARGVGEPAASLAANMGITVFYISFDRWLNDPAGPELDDLVRQGFAEFQSIASGS